MASAAVEPLLPQQQQQQQQLQLGNLDKMLVHVLRCPQCTFLTLAQKRLQQHIAEAHPGEPIFYTLHTCAVCSAVTTEKHLMEEHRLLYHCGETEDSLLLTALPAVVDGGESHANAAAVSAAAVSAAVSAAATSLAGSIESKIAMDSVLLGNLSSMLESGSHGPIAAIPNQPVFPTEYITAMPVASTAARSPAASYPNGLHGNNNNNNNSTHSNYNKRRCQRGIQQRQVARAAAFLGVDAVAPLIGRQSQTPNQHHHQKQQQQHTLPPNSVELMEDEAYLGEDSAKPWLCRVCSTCFPHQASLRRHMKLHDTNKRFKCDKCHKRFSYRCNLMLHYRTHTNERPFHCVTCGARFNQRVHLQNHIQNVHSGPGGVRPAVTHECDICGAWFVQINALTRHQRLHHDEAAGTVAKRHSNDSLKHEPELPESDDRNGDHDNRDLPPPQLEASNVPDDQLEQPVDSKNAEAPRLCEMETSET